MKIILDVFYTAGYAYAAGVLFSGWKDEEPVNIIHNITEITAPYIPGEFYKRELPPLLNILGKIKENMEIIVIDGCVYLDSKGRPGLGKYLYDSLKYKIPVIGAAKTKFAGLQAVEIFRGKSLKPLYITSIGIDAEIAAQYIKSMSGNYRIPYLIKLADKISKNSADSY